MKLLLLLIATISLMGIATATPPDDNTATTQDWNYCGNPVQYWGQVGCNPNPTSDGYVELHAAYTFSATAPAGQKDVYIVVVPGNYNTQGTCFTPPISQCIPGTDEDLQHYYGSTVERYCCPYWLAGPAVYQTYWYEPRSGNFTWQAMIYNQDGTYSYGTPTYIPQG